MTIKWEEINQDNQKYLNQVFELYDDAFPIEVREPHDIFLQSLQYSENKAPNNYRILIGLKDNQIVSFVTAHYLADANTGFIVYLATNPNVRSRGLGTQTLLKLEEQLNNDAVSAGYSSLRAVILETEQQELVHTKVEREDCIKRERFYKRNGFRRINEISYLQPPLNGGWEHVPLNLFLKVLHNNPITQQEVILIIRAMYQEKYAGVNRIDPHVLNDGLRKMGLQAVKGIK